MTLPSTYARPVALNEEEKGAVTAELWRRRSDAQRWLEEHPTSYLATVERRDFGDRITLVVGSGATADVRIDDPNIRPEHVAVTVLADGFRVAAVDAMARFGIAGAERGEAYVGPGFVELGRYRLRLSHQGLPAIVVMDTEHLRRHDAVKIRYFPVDLSYRFVAPLERASRPEEVTILSTRGQERRGLRIGWFDLELAGQPLRLAATRLLEPGVGESAYAIYFRDRTTGRETYSVGRYLDPEPASDGAFVVDFNLAYNPACAFSPHYNCPIPTRENDLPVEVRAGELTPEGAHPSAD